MNRDTGNKQLFKDKGTYVVLAGHLLNGKSDPIEKLKLLQQRFKKVSFLFCFPANLTEESWQLNQIYGLSRSPGVCFMGIHFSDQARITDDRTALSELIVKEYLTFPVLISEKEFPKVNIGSPRKSHFAVNYIFIYYSLKLYAYISI